MKEYKIAQDAVLTEYRVSGTIYSNMVIQRDQIINIWGWCNKIGAYIYGDFMGETKYGVVNETGEWKIQFSPRGYTTKPQNLRIYPKSGEVTVFSGILIGDK